MHDPCHWNKPFLLTSILCTTPVTEINHFYCTLQQQAQQLAQPWGAGIAQWLERRTHDQKVAGSNPCWSGGGIFFSRVNFLCWLLFRYLFHPRVTAVACKRPRSFCQKRRWQVTAKHAYTLHMWLCMKWHGAWLYGVHRTHWEWLSGSRFLWHQPCQRCKYTTSVDIQKRAIKTIHSCRTTCERSESAQERRIMLYKKATNNN